MFTLEVFNQEDKCVFTKEGDNTVLFMQLGKKKMMPIWDEFAEVDSPIKYRISENGNPIIIHFAEEYD